MAIVSIMQYLLSFDFRISNVGSHEYKREICKDIYLKWSVDCLAWLVPRQDADDEEFKDILHEFDIKDMDLGLHIQQVIYYP
jgi:hypothetical protein